MKTKILLIVFCIFLLTFQASAKLSVMVRGGAGTSNGLIGNTTYDISHDIFASYIYHDKFTPTTAGVVNYIHVYISGGSGDTVCLSIFNASGTKLASVSGSPGTDVAGWYNLTLNTPVTLATATNYYLGIDITGSGVQTVLYFKDAGDGGFYDTNASFNCGDNIVAEESGWYLTDDIAIVANNILGDPS